MTYPFQYFFLEKNSNDTIFVPVPSGVSFDPAGEFTIDAWIKIPDVTTNKCILSQEDVFSFFICDGKLQFCMAGCLPAAEYQEPLEPNEWYYVAVTCYQKVISLFVDAAEPVDTILSGNCKSSAKQLLIGENFFGEIRQIRIYPYSLTFDEIKKMHYQMVLTKDMSACYDFTCFPAREQRTKKEIRIGENSSIFFGAPSAVYTPGDYFAVKGGNDAAINPGGALDGACTVQQWFFFQPREDSDNYILFSNTDAFFSSGMEISLVKKDNSYYLKTVFANFQEESNAVLSKEAVAENQWVNVAVTYENSMLCIYLNGMLSIKKTDLKKAKQPLVYKVTQIGAGYSSGGNGCDWFSGCISRTDVWSRALSVHEVEKYMSEEPEVQEGLCASWSMFMRTVVNTCDFAPLARANELHIADQAEKAVTMCAENHQPLRSDNLPEPLSPEELKLCREKFFSEIRGMDCGEMENILAQPMVSSYRKEETVYFIIHKKEYSYTISSISAGRLEDELDEWRIEVVLNIISALLDFLLSIHLAYNPRIAAFILDAILSLAAVRAAFAAVKDNDKSSVISFIYNLIKVLFSENRIIVLIKLTVQISFWGLLTMIAKVTAKMVNPWAYLAVWAASLSAVIIVLFLRKPRPNPRISIVSIAFHHGTLGYIDSINVRKNATEQWPWPEWCDGRAVTSPAVYRLSSFTVPGSHPALAVKLIGSRDLNGTYSVRGTMLAAGSALLGSTATVRAAFVGGNLVGEVVMFELPNHIMHQGGIRKEQIEWRWEYQNPEGGEWITMRTTRHTIYTILSSVHAPWRSSDAQGLLYSRPWTDVLDMLIPYVQGLSAPGAVMSGIVDMIYNRFHLIYSGGAAWAISVDPATQTQMLYLHAFLTRNAARENTVNCQDCAALTTVFANILGCDMRVQVIAPNTGGAYRTGKVLLIGESTWRYPHSEHSGEGFFDYHFVAVLNVLGDISNGTTYVYDACMKLNDSTDPWEANPTNPQLACGMVFSQYAGFPAVPLQTPVVNNSYREHTCANTQDGIGNCELGNRYIVTLHF